MSRRNPEEGPANSEDSLSRSSERGRFRLSLGLLVSGIVILAASYVGKDAGPETIATYNATLMGAGLVGAGAFGVLTGRRAR